MIRKSKNFTLRPYLQSDLASLVKHINDEEIARNTLMIPHPYTMKDAQDWLRMTRNTARKKNRTSIDFAIEIDGEAVGGISIMKIQDHKAEIGYWLGRAYWGQGIMTRVVKRITRYGFKELDLKRMYAVVFAHNKGSMRVLEKAGYKFEAVLRKSEKKGGKLVDVHLYAKVR